MAARTGQAPSQQQLRLMAMVARLYHVRGVRQRDIAERLEMSQARVSRLLGQAEELGIVRTVVVAPEGLHPDLEERLEERHGLQEVHVVDVPGGEEDVPEALGGAAARYLADAPTLGGCIGFTSWSTTLREMTRQLEPVRRAGAAHVVEMLGDLGSPLLQHEAARATLRLARSLDAEPVFLRAPGVMATRELRDAALRDAHVQRALRMLDRMDTAFIGVGPADFHGPLREGDNFFGAEQLARIRRAGAVGQLNQRFVDAQGRPVATPLDDLVLGVTLAQLRQARRRVVVAGGPSKHAALAAALAGGWVDVLVTDVDSAEHLTESPAPSPLAERRAAV